MYSIFFCYYLYILQHFLHHNAGVLMHFYLIPRKNIFDKIILKEAL